MPINPITVSKLKTFVLVGHSNADGWAPLEDMISSPYNAWLRSRAGGGYAASPNIANDYYENCYVSTSAQPFPSPQGTPVTTTPGQVEWLELTTANTASPNDPHPHSSPYDYPNNRGSCYPRWEYWSINPFYGGSLYLTPSDPNHYGTVCGMEIPFMWLWKHYWGEQVGMVKMAFSSTYMMAAEGDKDNNVASIWLGTWGGETTPVSTPSPGGPSPAPTPAPVPNVPSSVAGNVYGQYAYWTPDEKFDWAPSTDRIYKMWYQKMVGSAAALPTGTEMDVQCVILWMGDNEALRGNRNLLQGFEDNYRELIDRMRSDLVANNWTTLAKEKIPVIIPGVDEGYNNPSTNPSPDFNTVDFCNEAIRRIADQDPYVTWLSPADWAMMSDDGRTSTYAGIPNPYNHYGATGYRQAAQEVMDAFRDISEDPFDAFDIDDAMTVNEARRRVRLYYGRSKSGTDIDDDLLLLHLNAAMQHCFNQLGDNAWWLRRIEELYLDAGPNKEVTLPRYVHRLMKIEDPSDLEYPLRFTQLGHVDGGKLQILMNERGQGTYRCHFITMPRELTQGDEKLPCPKNIAEWIVVETCARLAGSSTNAALAGFFAGESAKLMDSARRSVSQTQRTKRDRMKTVRRYPILGYRRSHYQLWANDNSR